MRTRRLTPSLLRLTLGGPGAVGFESHVPVEHVRLIFPDPDTGTLRLPERDGNALRWPRPLPPSREYTVRRFDPEAREIDIDIVLHPGGLASDWALRAVPGERAHLAGPPGGLVVPDSYDRFLFAGDLTALPAIACWLEALPADAAGWAFIEVADAAEELALARPENVELRWLHGGGALVDAVRALRVPDGESMYAWVAGEAGLVRPLRRWIRDELGLGPADSSVTGYWKRGISDFDEEDR